MHGFRDNDVLSQARYDVIVILPFHAIFHDRFCKSDHYFLIAFHSNFLSAINGLRDSEVLFFPDMTSSSVLHQGRFRRLFMTNSEKVTMTSRLRSIVTFCLGCMVSEITMFYCKKDMTSSWFLRQGALHAIFLDGFWKSDYDFLIAFYSNLLSLMHGFRDNDAILQAGYDVIVISPPGGAPLHFSWRILKERPWLPDSIL